MTTAARKLIWKDVLWPGRWSYPDGRVLRVTGGDVRNALRQGRRMLANRLGVPWNWEHQPDAFPRPAAEMSAAVYGDRDRRADWARNVIAPVAGYEVRDVPGRGPVLFAAVEYGRLTADERRRLVKAEKVSCRLDRNFTDLRGDGTKYPGLVVSHVAVTPKPVEPDQGPFEMSAGWPADETFYLGAAAMADELDDDDAPEGTDLETPAAPAPAAGGDDPDLQALIEALRGAGMNIPDEVMDLKHLVIAVKASGKPAGGPAGGGDPDGLDYSAGGGGTQAGASPPMLMSQAAMAEKRPAVVEVDRHELKARIKRLLNSGRVSPEVADALMREHGGFEMSYLPTGVPQVTADNLLGRVAAFETLPKGMVLAKSQPKGFDMSHTRPVAPPAKFAKKAGGPGEAEVKAATEFLCGGLPGQPAPK